MKLNWSLMRDLMRVDLLTMKGGKNNNRSIFTLMLVFFWATGFFISPIAGVYIPFLLGAIFVVTLFSNEIKYHSGQIWALLPVSRKDIVNARFLLCIGIFCMVCAATYLVMLLAMPLRLWRFLMDGDDMEILTMAAEKFGMSPMGLFNTAYFAACAFGLVCMTGALRRYFRDPNAFDGQIQFTQKLKKAGKAENFFGILIIGAIVVWALIACGILPVGPVWSMAGAFLMQLMQAADGFIMAAVMLTMSVMHSVYSYVCTVIEYEAKEL